MRYSTPCPCLRPYPDDDHVLPLAAPRVVVAGNDIILVTWAAMVGRCEAAAKERGGEVGDPVDKYEPLAELEPTTSRSRCSAPEAGVVPPIEREG